MHSVRHVFSSVIEKSWERMHVKSIFIIHSHFKVLGSVTNVIGKCRLRSKDGTAKDVGTNDKKIFIQLNGLPSGYKGTQSFLKAAPKVF